MFAHLSQLIPIPFANVVVPVLILATKGRESELVRDQAIEVLNFLITLIIVYMALAFTIVGILCYIPIGLFHLIVLLLGALAANRGEKYRYPLCMRLLT